MTVQEVDGRTARAQRTRAAVVEALISLLEEGRLQPTAAEIAARAGVAERTLFQHFADRDALFAAVSERQAERLTEMWVEIPRDAPFAERLDAFVDLRARVYEFVTPVRRGALLMAPQSQVVAEGVAGFRGSSAGKRLPSSSPSSPLCPRASARPRGRRWAPSRRGRPGRSCAATRACPSSAPGRRCASPSRDSSLASL